MKLGILSDIHVDLEHSEPEKILDGLAAAMKKNGIDAMIIAGDVANDYKTTLRFLKAIEKKTGIRCLFVPGNHDIWNEHHPDMTAWDIYEALQEFPGNLANGPLSISEDWIAIGDLGWYDYSFGSRKYSIKDFDRMKIGDRLWQDKIKAKWEKPTIEMHHYFYEKLEKQLAANQDKKIIFITHALPIIDFTVQSPNRMWNYLNAFLGSSQYGELALKYSVAYSISGHVHYRKEKNYENTRFICNCLNYASQWVDNEDPMLEVERAIKTITID